MKTNKLYFTFTNSVKDIDERRVCITAGKNDNGYNSETGKYCRLTGICDKSFFEQLKNPISDQKLIEEVNELLAYLNIHNSIDEEEGHQIISRINKLL